MKPVKIKGDVMWANLNTVNKLSLKYQVEICNLSQKAVEALQDQAMLDVNHSEDKGHYITPKSSKFPIKAFDKDGEELVNVLIGNGSKCTAVIKPYKNKFNGNINAGISAITVTDMISYNPEGADEEVAEEEEAV
jgi:hypothetical protein